jgi:hypothetical protein
LGVLFDWHPPRYIPPHSTFFFFFFFENQQEKERKTKGDFDGSSSFTIYDSSSSSSSAPFSLSRLCCWDVYSNYLALVWVQKKKVRSYSID